MLTGRAQTGSQRRQGSSCKLIFYRTPRKIREANYSDNHRGPEAFPWKSGITQDYLTPCSSLRGRRARAAAAQHQHLLLCWLGVCDPNYRAARFWQPPGICLWMHRAWFAELSVTEGWSCGVWDLVLTPVSLSPVPLLWEPSK